MLSNVFIMRIGDIEKNYTRSVLNNMCDQSKVPIWGYDSNKCSGTKTFSAKTHSLLLRAIQEQGFAYVLFKPSKKGDIIGLAIVKSLYSRMIGPLICITGSNEDNGWLDPTCKGSSSWDYQFDIDQYWDLTQIPNNIFTHDTLQAISKLGQNSVHAISFSQSRGYRDLNQYLSEHINGVIKYVKPMYSHLH